ncbi:MAG: anhydro-N-acetylmuramic acid kinase [Nitrospiraceae bacterium]
MYVIGLMSGTSGDGVDAALVRIDGGGARLRIAPVAFAAQPYTAAFQRRLMHAALSGSVREICHLNAVLGEWFARAALRVIAQAGLSSRDVWLIGSHGQTLHHLPKGVREPGLGLVRSTLQIGETAVIAERTGITTVGNFRARDVAAGGQGAPLVPAVHHLLFQHRTKTRLVVNLGGISNVTYLPAGGDATTVRAFDTGPANMLLDGAMQRLTDGRRRMDRNGALACTGQPDPVLLAQLLRHPFLSQRPPKSTGREEFGEPFLDEIFRVQRRRRLSSATLLATLARFTAEAVWTARCWCPGPIHELLIAGGGVRNRAVMAALADVAAPATVRTVDEVGWASQALECTAFAAFAYQTMHGGCGTLAQVTGARHPVVMGDIVPGGQPWSLGLRVVSPRSSTHSRRPRTRRRAS